jgi:ribosomal protein S18 acetylase RimI-like enzyme
VTLKACSRGGWVVEVELMTARADDVARVLELRGELAAWLVARGVAMWQTPIPSEVVAGWIDQGALWVCRERDRVVGTVVLLDRDPEFWGDDDTPARYVHLLMVDRAHAGQDLGGRILRCAEQLAEAGGARYLRLDAASDIAPLQRWYEQRGYVAVGRRVIDAGGQRFDVTLRQKDLVAASCHTIAIS